MTTETTTRTDVYTCVTNRIVEALEQGVRPWMQPWSTKGLAGQISKPLRSNGQAYSGINIVTLWIEAIERGFTSPYWLTFRQAKELGGSVKKGEHGSPIVYASSFKKTATTEEGNEVEQEIRFLKQYFVFCSDQITGLPSHFYATPTQPKPLIERIATADQFFANTKADIRYGGNRAYYSLAEDYIQMPPFAAFRDAESHAATLAHELVHFSMHPNRLNRQFGQNRFGDEAYAKEELVAELGSAFLCADLQITPEVRDDHASYLDSWIKVLCGDRRQIFSAAAHASKAVEFLHSLQPRPVA